MLNYKNNRFLCIEIHRILFGLVSLYESQHLGADFFVLNILNVIFVFEIKSF